MMYVSIIFGYIFCILVMKYDIVYSIPPNLQGLSEWQDASLWIYIILGGGWFVKPTLYLLTSFSDIMTLFDTFYNNVMRILVL